MPPPVAAWSRRARRRPGRTRERSGGWVAVGVGRGVGRRLAVVARRRRWSAVRAGRASGLGDAGVLRRGAVLVVGVAVLAVEDDQDDPADDGNQADQDPPADA